MLEIHSKIHELGNGDQIGHLNFQPIISAESNGYSSNITTIEPERPQPQQFSSEPVHQFISAMAQQQMPDPPSPVFPMNLSISRVVNEPMDLSNDRNEEPVSSLKIEPVVSTLAESDDESPSLQIVEEPVIRNSTSLVDLYPMTTLKPEYVEEQLKRVDEMAFSSRMSEMEPLRDLPMEILNND